MTLISLAILALATSQEPLTPRELDDAAREASLQAAERFNGFLDSKDTLKPRVLRTTPAGRLRPGKILVFVAGGDREKTSIVCVCGVRDKKMVVDSISLSRKTAPRPDADNRIQAAEWVDQIVHGVFSSNAKRDLIQQEWNEERDAAIKIGRRWIYTDGNIQILVGGDMRSMDVSVRHHKSEHVPDR